MWKTPAGISRKSILIVDSDPASLHLLENTLQNDYKVYTASSGKQAFTFLGRTIPDLILLDVDNVDCDGYELIRRLKHDAVWAAIPVIFLTAVLDRENEQEAFRLGVVDYITKPIAPGVVRARAKLHMELDGYKRNLERIVEIRTDQLRLTQDSILDMLSNVTAYRDNETGAHLLRTTIFVELLANRLLQSRHPRYLITSDYVDNIVRSSKLHDIGKVAVPDTILLKPGTLTNQEFELIKKHTLLGSQIIGDAIDDMGNPPSFLHTAREIIISHHEWWNGNGYPYGLREDEIPLPGRLMAVADVYDALVSKRPYKEALSHEESVSVIMRSAGTHFDPYLLELCSDVFDSFPIIVSQYRDEHYPKQMLKN